MPPAAGLNGLGQRAFRGQEKQVIAGNLGRRLQKTGLGAAYLGRGTVDDQGRIGSLPGAGAADPACRHVISRTRVDPRPCFQIWLMRINHSRSSSEISS